VCLPLCRSVRPGEPKEVESEKHEGLRKQEAEGPGLGKDHTRHCATLIRLQSKSRIQRRIQRAWILIYSLQCFRDTRVTFDTETKTGKEQEVKYNWGNWNNNAENKREPHVSVTTTTNEPPALAAAIRFGCWSVCFQVRVRCVLRVVSICKRCLLYSPPPNPQIIQHPFASQLEDPHHSVLHDHWRRTTTQQRVLLGRDHLWQLWNVGEALSRNRP